MSSILKYAEDNYRKVNTFIASLVFLLTPLAYFENIIENSNFAKKTVFYALVFLFGIFQFITVKNKKEKVFYLKNNLMSIFILLLLVFLLWNIICALFALKPVIAIGVTIEMAAKIFIAFIFLVAAKNINLNRVLYYGVIAVLVVSIIGILQKFDIVETFFNQVAPPASTFVNKNMAAHFMGFSFIFALILFLFNKSKRIFYISSITIIIQIVYCMYTSSKGLIVSLFFTGIFIIILNYILNKKAGIKLYLFNNKKIKTLILIIIIPIFIVSISEKYLSIKNKEIPIISKILNKSFITGKSSSVSHRLAVWQNSVEIIKDSPFFGVGPNNFQIIYSKYNRIVKSDYDFSPTLIYTNAHNDVIQYFTDTGITGGILYILIALFVPVMTLMAVQNNKLKQKRRKKYVGFLSASLFIVFFYSLFEFTVTSSPASGTLMWPLMGLWMYQINKILPESKNKFIIKINEKMIAIYNKKRQSNIFLISFICSGIMLAVSIFNIIGARYFFKAYAYKMGTPKKKFSCEIFTENLNKAVMYMPFYMTAQRMRANEFVICNEPTEKNLEILESYLKDNPYSLVLMRNIVKYSYQLKKYEKTEFMADEYLKIYPHSAEILIYKGNLLVLKNSLDEAEKWYKQILKMDISLQKDDELFIHLKIKELEERKLN